jgi:hypothetical protein
MARQFRFSIAGAIAPKQNALGRISAFFTPSTAIAEEAYGIAASSLASSLDIFASKIEAR